MKPRVLWIEDSARLELSNLVGPIYFSGKYDFTLAEDVTAAVQFLLVEIFDVLIVDVRLPPGPDPIWQDLYRRSGADKVNAQLGIKLLYWLLGLDRATYKIMPPSWVKPQFVTVFSVESSREIQEELDDLKITRYRQKVAELQDTILLDLIEQALPAPNIIH
jgi:hypothetical protein